ncbi:YfkD family protein [Niallia sp. XMNu-256]|uniref:YfkD famly protein n=1 Tax=Niallia sp. XMNu-256 TaxID=3082444 RepID=UPI0030CF461F
MKIKVVYLLIGLMFMVSFLPLAQAEKKPEHEETVPKQTTITVPDSVMNIAKENTFPNTTNDMPRLEPSELTKELIDTSKTKIENPELIRMLNETTVNSTPFALGYKAIVYLGQWPLNYESVETAPNWEYQKVNTNYYDNRSGTGAYKIHYVQEAQKIVRGGLTAKVANADQVKDMMLMKAMQKSNLPLAFETIIGAGTKKDQVYNVNPKMLGYLHGYAPAINEKGKVTYGEVYLMLKGRKRSILVKNVTTQGISAWIPIQDHVTFKFSASEQPQ